MAKPLPSSSKSEALPADPRSCEAGLGSAFSFLLKAQVKPVSDSFLLRPCEEKKRSFPFPPLPERCFLAQHGPVLC